MHVVVRGLALRSLCSLRLPNIAEYFLAPIRTGLIDHSPYVRKTAVMCIAKVFALVPSMVKDSDLVDVLYNLLKDKDVQVISNAIVALNEILSHNGGLAVNSAIVVHLLTRLSEFSEWSQCAVLELVNKYKPVNDDEMFAIMNFLEDRLKHANSAVVLAATKVFLNITRHLPKVHMSVYARLCAPLLTLMAGNIELAYTVLGHVVLLVSRAPEVFASEYKSFFCKYNDISCVKALKVQILTSLADNSNKGAIIAELSEYVTDVDPDISKLSVCAMAKICIKLESAADQTIKQLLSLIDLQMDYVTAQVCVILKDILRKYPERYEEIIPALEKCLKLVSEPEGKAAVIWMIGEYGDLIRMAPYILEPLIEVYDEESSYFVRTELLAASMKLFFKRPPEMQKMLGRLLRKAMQDSSNVDCKDRALFYYRLLQHDVLEAARIVHGMKGVINAFDDTNDAEMKERLIDEFNSLSVLYGLPAERFINLTVSRFQEARVEAVQNAGDSSATLVTGDQLSEPNVADVVSPGVQQKNSQISIGISQVSSPSVPVKPAASLDLFDDLVGLSLSPATAPPPVSISLLPKVSIDPPQFQAKWMSLQPALTLQLTIQSGAVSRFESLCTSAFLFTLASGNVNGTMKLYSYAQEAGTSKFFLLEAILNIATGAAKVTIKTESPSAASFETFYVSILSPILQK